jgi:hypothetical protein
MDTFYIILQTVLVFQLPNSPTKIWPPAESENVNFIHIQFNESYYEIKDQLKAATKRK